MTREIARDVLSVIRQSGRTALVVGLLLAAACVASFGTHALEARYQARAATQIADANQAAADRIATVEADAEAYVRAELSERLGPCLEALARADESIWQYFDATVIEREHPPTAKERAGHAELERDAYADYTGIRDQCRATADREPSQLGSVTVDR